MPSVIQGLLGEFIKLKQQQIVSVRYEWDTCTRTRDEGPFDYISLHYEDGSSRGAFDEERDDLIKLVEHDNDPYELLPYDEPGARGVINLCLKSLSLFKEFTLYELDWRYKSLGTCSVREQFRESEVHFNNPPMDSDYTENDELNREIASFLELGNSSTQKQEWFSFVRVDTTTYEVTGWYCFFVESGSETSIIPFDRELSEHELMLYENLT